MGVGITTGNVCSFTLVVRASREWLGTLMWAGKAVVPISSVFGRKAWRLADGFFSGGGGERACNVNRQNPLWREDLDLEHPVILGVCTKHVVCLESPCL